VNENSETKSFQIDHRHLAFFFIGAVAVCAVFFALGFVVGRAQAFEVASRDTETVRESLEVSLAANDASKTPRNNGGVATLNEAGTKSTNSETGSASKSDYRKDLDFYQAVKDQKVDQNFHPEDDKPGNRPPFEKPKNRPPAAAIPEKTRESGSGSLISLQVAAFKGAAEADKLAKTLRTKGYPVFIVSPSRQGPNQLIRVQIGPYTSEAEAMKMKGRLGTEGYAAIIKK
jgi:cell division septation protein DedD